MNGLGLNDRNEGPADEAWPGKARPEEPVVSLPYFEPESTAESSRRTGLAYTAGITFFATVAFMLFIGWGADLLLGTKPWGLVGGIVLGAIIAFIQFFRITNRIYHTPKDTPSVKPLMSGRDDEPRL